MTKQLGVDRDLPIVPDLAFGLKPESPRPPRRPGLDVASPDDIPAPWELADRGPRRYQRLIGLWTEMVTATVARRDRVHLFVSNPGDMAAVSDIWERLDAATRAGCTIAQLDSPDALLEFNRGMDLIVSSRLHGVLLAIVSGRPVLALSHERKVRALMSDAGVPEFCVDLATATNEEACGFWAAGEQLEPCGRRLRDYVETASSGCDSRTISFRSF